MSGRSSSSPDRLFWDGGRPAPPGWTGAGLASAEALVADGLAWVTGSVDAAYIGPALNRLPLWQVPFVLEEFRRVLRANGWLRVRVPDLDAAVHAYLADDADFFWSDDWDHGAGALADHLLDWGRARSAFTASFLAELLERAGFTSVSIRSADGSDSHDPLLARPDRDAGRSCCAEGRRLADPPLAPLGPTATQVHLSWSDEHPRAPSVTWCGPADAAAAVRIRPWGTTTWRKWSASGQPTIDGDEAPWVFRVTGGETDLAPATRYEYEVVHELDGHTHTALRHSFVTPSDDPAAVVSFVFVADTGIDGRPDGLCDGAGRTVEEIVALAPDFVLVGGDLAYRSSDPRLRTPGDGVRAWLDQIAPIASQLPVMVQYGNHDTELGERFRDWAAHLTHPTGFGGGRCYSFTAGCCHVVGFFAPSDVVDPAAVAWLEADLAAARAAGSPWLVVFQHHPLFSGGASHPASPRLRQALSPTLERHRVDLHLSAHDQNLERTFPLRNAATSPSPACTALDRYRQGGGVVYAKVSPGGKRSDRGGGFSSLARPLPPHIAVGDDTRHHFAHVQVAPGQLCVEIHGFADAGSPLELVDRFVISGSDGTADPAATKPPLPFGARP